MSADPLCCLCGAPTPRHDSKATFTLNLGQRHGPRAVLCWHYAAGCLAADALHDEIAAADNLADAALGDTIIAAVYLRLLDRIGETHGPDVLRGAVDIRRDLDHPLITLRGPGLLWGRRSPRLRGLR